MTESDRTGRWAVDEPLDNGLRHVRVVLVRHGESQWNAQGIVQGQAGPGLTSLGHQQAHRTAQEVQDQFPDARLIVRSDLTRVAETAQPYELVADLPVHLDERLREIDNGAWTGKTQAQVAEEFVDEVVAIRHGDDIPRGGTGETFGDVRSRVNAALFDIANMEAPTVIVFTHGGPIRAAVSEVFALPASGHRLVEPPTNCSFTVLKQTIDAVGQLVSTSLESYNRDDHLRDLVHLGDPRAADRAQSRADERVRRRASVHGQDQRR